MPDHRGITHPGIPHHRQNILDVDHRVVVLPVAAVSHSREIKSDDAVITGKERRDEIPPSGMCTITVYKHQRRFIVLRPPPGQIMYPATVDLYVPGNTRILQGLPEPLRRGGGA
jgi:hypothetical protein